MIQCINLIATNKNVGSFNVIEKKFVIKGQFYTNFSIRKIMLKDPSVFRKSHKKNKKL